MNGGAASADIVATRFNTTRSRVPVDSGDSTIFSARLVRPPILPYVSEKPLELQIAQCFANMSFSLDIDEQLFG
jgi:hypothetical protein